MAEPPFTRAAPLTAVLRQVLRPSPGYLAGLRQGWAFA